MKFLEFAQKYAAISDEILAYQKPQRLVEGALYEKRIEVQREVTRTYRLLSMGGFKSPAFDATLNVVVQPSETPEYGMWLCVVVVLLGSEAFAGQIYEYMPIVGFERLAKIRETVDLYISGVLDELPHKMPWEAQDETTDQIIKAPS